MKVIGLNVSSSALSGVVLDGETGELVASATRPVQADIQSEYEWESLQQPELVVDIADQLLEELLTACGDVQRVGICGDAQSLLYLDQDGVAVSPLYTAEDRRGHEVFRDDKTYAEALSILSGYALEPGNACVTHMYNQLNLQTPVKASIFCTLADYLVMGWLNVSAPVVHESLAKTFGCFDDSAFHDFDCKKLEETGFKVSYLPKVTSDLSPLGEEEGLAVYPAITCALAESIVTDEASRLQFEPEAEYRTAIGAALMTLR